jgi:uncharacterized protein YkwD
MPGAAPEVLGKRLDPAWSDIRMTRRATLLLAALALALVMPSISPGRAAAADLTVDQAEAAMVQALNSDRTDRGIARVAVDPRLMTIARKRSIDMATKNYFSHTQPDGRNVFDMIQSSGIAWSSAGEIIAWNTWPTLESSVGAANTGWLESPGHYSILTDASYNSLGVGLAVDATGKKLWTAVFVREPTTTITSASTIATAGRPSLSVRLSSGHHYAYLRWTTPSAPAGVKYYQVQRRIGTGSWSTTARTASHRLTRYVRLHHTYRFRVRVIDKLGRAGAWSYVRTVRP